MTVWQAPTWIRSIYTRFPLVTLDQEDEITHAAGPVLWIAPSDDEASWASSDAECLRAQLLFRLRGVNVSFRHWANASTAPAGTLPALQLDGSLIAAKEVRGWLDQRYQVDELQGMPDQATYDRAVALANLVLGRIKPKQHLESSVPPTLAAGLTTPLPASLTGDGREMDLELAQKRAEEAWEAAEAVVGAEWAMGASKPTSLDALLAAYVYTDRKSLDDHPDLLAYADRVMKNAQSRTLR